MGRSETSLKISARYPGALVFIWIGFVCSISFMEAWLKFRAPNVTVPIGLSIGRLIFGALNKVEWVIAILITAWASYHKIGARSLAFFFIPLAVLLFQTIFLLPALKLRVDMVLQGIELSPSLLHVYYLIGESLKVVFLFIFGLYLFLVSDELA